jgi:pimeloyl-ACP methyl ester carboxylesterase
VRKATLPHGYALALLLIVCPCIVAQIQKSQSPTGDEQPKQEMMSRGEVTDTIAATRKIVSPNGVEELLPVQINGITQWMSIRGRDRRNPILLFLHGGPGSPEMPAAYTYQSPWEDYFTVVQWDQRSTGKTYAANDPNAVASTITVEQMTSDAEEVVRYLQKRYDKKKIFLLGHSWGSVLGVALAQRHPEWFYAYLGVGQMANTQRSEELGYRFAVEQAKAHDNTEAEQELAAIAPYPGDITKLTIAKVGVQRKWVMYYGGLTYGRTDFKYDANAWELSPDYTEKELDTEGDGSFASLTHLVGAFVTLNYDSVTRFKCPIFLFEGRHDYTVSDVVAEEWFKHIEAPYKKLVWFDNSAHMVYQEQPGQFLYYLITDLYPLAAKAGDVAPASDHVER